MTSNDVGTEIALAIIYLERTKVKLVELHNQVDIAGMVTSEEKLAMYSVSEQAENCAALVYKKVGRLRRFFFRWRSQ